MNWKRNSFKIKLNELGEHAKVLKNIFGEIHIVRIEIGDSGPETRIEIETSESEKIIYQNIDKDFIDYPVHSGNSEYHSFSGGEKADNLVKYLNHGDLIIRVFGDPKKTIKRFTLIFEA